MILLLVLLQTIYAPSTPRDNFEADAKLAASKLQIPPPPVQVSSDRPWAAWVPHGVGAEWVIYVRPDFLRSADPLARRSVAYHETCHLYFGNNRRAFIRNEEQLIHLMVAGCVEWLHGPDYHRAMTQMPCQHWYPYEAKRYNRLIGKERCR